MIYRIKGRRFRACGSRCAEGFKADRSAGAIYPPCKKPGGGFYLMREDASMAEGWCAYCSADVRSQTGLSALRRKAAKVCKARGHKMLWVYPPPGQMWQMGACRMCGKGVMTNAKPQPNETDISGEAVALNCPNFFTEEEKKIIGACAYKVWQEIACDCLIAIGQRWGKNPESVTLPRSHVMELACDASRTEDMLRRENHADLAERICRLDTSIYPLVRHAFPHAYYGM